jgi:4-amino-4-deoxy-L-arabinose transferase-like glycosyltransferase
MPTDRFGRVAARRLLDRWQERLALLAVVLAALALRLWRLDQNGFGTEYYTAGVRSMLDDPHNFLFNAFDPVGFLSLDKPPVAFWIQVASAKLFGFSGLSILLPQVVEGVAAVVLLHHLVRRRFGQPAGWLAALFLALTPLSVAVDRSSNTDSCLVLTLLAAAWALTLAAERASWRRLVLAMALVGVGFNVKMLAAFMIVPSFALVYLLAAPAALPRRLAHLAGGGLVLAAVSLSWVALYDLTPPDHRPFAGSTRGNSMVELAFVEYGLERLAGRAGRLAGSGRGGAPVATADATAPNAGAPDRAALRGAGMLGGSRVPAGPLRLSDPLLAAQVGWLLPLALLGTVAAAALVRRRWPLAPEHAGLLLWSGWALTTGAVLSYAGGIFHTYYMDQLAPPLGALAGIGLAALWIRFRQGAAGWFLLPAALLATAAWQAYLGAGYLGWTFSAAQGIGAAIIELVTERLTDWRMALYLTLIGGSLAAALGLVAAHRRAALRPLAPRAGASALGIGIAALLASPTAWALSTVLARGDVWFPAADLALLSPGAAEPGRRWRGLGALDDIDTLVGFLEANRDGERFMLATATALQAAPIIVRTGEPVMAIGGYSGSDPIVTTEQLERLVADRQLRFVLVGAGAPRQNPRRENRQRALLQWLEENGRPVEPALWRAASAADAPADASRATSGRRGRAGAETLQIFDLRPAGALRGAR